MPTASTERARLRGAGGRGLAGLLLIAATLGAGLAPGVADTPSPADPDDPAQVARGARVYSEACAACHGAALEGQPDWQTPNPDGTLPAPPHDAEGHTWHHADGLLFRYTKLGGAVLFKDLPGVESAMPGFGEVLSDKDIWDVLAFIKTHWPEEMRAYQHAASANEK